MLIYNISDPTSPEKVGEYLDTGTSHGISIKNKFAYIADLDEGLEVYNVTDPGQPQKIKTYFYKSEATEITFEHSICFVALTDSRFIALNVSNPLDINQLGEYNITGGLDFFTTENYAFIPERPSGLVILDIKNSSDIQLVGEYNDGEYIRSVFVEEDYIYAACTTNGFKIISISEPSNPELIGEYNDVGDNLGVYGVHKYRNYALLCDYDEGLKVLDISDPKNPYLSGSYNGSRFFGICNKENNAIIVQSGGIIQIVKLVELVTTTNVPTSISSAVTTSNEKTPFFTIPNIIILSLVIVKCKPKRGKKAKRN